MLSDLFHTPGALSARLTCCARHLSVRSDTCTCCNTPPPQGTPALGCGQIALHLLERGILRPGAILRGSFSCHYLCPLVQAEASATYAWQSIECHTKNSTSWNTSIRQGINTDHFSKCREGSTCLAENLWPGSPF